MKHEFKTKHEAVAAGYIPTSGKAGKTIETYRGIDIKMRDISGGSYYGYHFCVAPEIPPFNVQFGESVTVGLTEAENKGGGVGSYTAMFDPESYEQALIDARGAIDRYLGDFIDIEYWTHTPDGETYAVMPETKQCFGPLRQEEIGNITEDDERWDTEDFEWLNKSSVFWEA